MRLLFVGDVVGSPGRRALRELLPRLREEHRPDWVVVNGENAAGGLGITSKLVRELLDDLEVDVITLGNHAYQHRDVYALLDTEDRIVRPANYPKGNPGRGYTVVERDGSRLAVVNLSGMVFVQAARSPFAEIDAIIAELRGRADHVIVDFHEEALEAAREQGDYYIEGDATVSRRNLTLLRSRSRWKRTQVSRTWRISTTRDRFIASFGMMVQSPVISG